MFEPVCRWPATAMRMGFGTISIDPPRLSAPTTIVPPLVFRPSKPPHKATSVGTPKPAPVLSASIGRIWIENSSSRGLRSPTRRFHVAGKGDARSSAELAVKHDSWSKVCGQAARRLRPKVRRWRWIMREGEGQPLRLLVDLDGASLRWLDEQIRSAEHPLID